MNLSHDGRVMRGVLTVTYGCRREVLQEDRLEHGHKTRIAKNRKQLQVNYRGQLS